MVTPDGTDDQATADPESELDRLRDENNALRSRLDTRSRWRRWLTVVLVILTTVSVVGTTVAVWAHETVFDTDLFMETVQPALDDPALYEAFSERVTDEAITALDVEARVSVTLTAVDEYLSQALLDAIDISERAKRFSIDSSGRRWQFRGADCRPDQRPHRDDRRRPLHLRGVQGAFP